jgi:nucleoside-diphosphate-sugar epimerase
VRFDLGFADAHAVNVAGTERMVALAERARSLGARGRFVHVSTAYVHGRCSGVARESGPSQPPEFRNTYEQTKHLAEQVVARLGDAAIVRPSIVVGDSQTGWTSSFNVVYVPLRAVLTGAIDVVPAPADAVLDLVPVDQVVDIICAVLDVPSMRGVIHAVSGSMAPTIAEFMRLCFAHVGLPAAPCVPAAVDRIGVYAPYVDVWATFQYGRGRRLGVQRTPIAALVPPMLDHAVATHWGRRRILRPSPRLALAA